MYTLFLLRVVQKSWPFLLGLILGIYFITLNITGKSFTHFPGDLGDGRFNTYLLEHAHQFFTGKTASLWNADFMYPEPEVITFSDNLVGSAPFYSIFRFIGFDRETSFQWWFLTMVILNYFCCYLFLRNYFKNHYAAVLGAMVFAFSMALHSQVTHAQTFPRFAIPLAFWMGVLFMEKLNPRYFFGTVFFIVYQLYCGIYTGFMLSVPITFLLVFSIIHQWGLFKEKIKNRKWLGIMSGSLLFNMLIVLPLMLPYFQRARQTGFNSYETIFQSLPTVKSHFFSSNGSALWDFLNETGIKYTAWWDHQIFAGGMATFCLLMTGFIIIIKIARKKDILKTPVTRSLIILFCTGLMTFLIFMRFYDFSLYQLVYYLPGFGSMRALQRIINIELIYFAMATAFVFAIIPQKKKGYSMLLFLLFAGIITVDNYYKEGVAYRTDKGTSQARVSQVVEKMKSIPAGSLVSYEPVQIESSPIGYQIDAMLASQTLRLKCVNGYSGTSPYGYSLYWAEMNSKAREEWFKIKEFMPDTVYVIK